MERSAIILTGNSSKEINIEKVVLELEGTPVINYVVDAVKDIVEEIVVVVNSQKTADMYSEIMSPEVKFAVNNEGHKSALAQALAGFEAAHGEYSLVLPSGSIFVSEEVASLLFDLCVGKAAVVPRWTNQMIEPLHAVYSTPRALEASKAALAEGEIDMEAMVERLRGVRYISTMVIEQLDPEFKTFFTIKGQVDLKKALVMSRPKPQKKKKSKR